MDKYELYSVDLEGSSGPLAQLGWSVRLIIERSRVQIPYGPFKKCLEPA